MEHNINLDKQQFKVTKIIETVMTWLLGFCFLIGFITVAKIADAVYRYLHNTSSNYGFVDIIMQLINQEKDLKAIETLGTIYRAFIFILIISFAILVIFRIVSKEMSKLMQFSSVTAISSILFSCYLLFITKDIFYAIKSINNRLYSSDFSKAIYLMAKLQYIKDLGYIIYIVLILSLAITFVAFVCNFYETILKTDKASSKYLSLLVLNSTIICLANLGIYNYYVIRNANIINPFNYFVFGYTLDDKGEIKSKAYVNYKKIETKYIDPFLRNFLEEGLTFDIENSKKTLEGKENLKIEASYDLEKANELGIKINKLSKYVKLIDKPILIKKKEDLIEKKLEHYLRKYDTRYLTKSTKDEHTGLYYLLDENKNLDIVFVQKLKIQYLPYNITKMLSKDTEYVYNTIYIGNVFVNSKKDVIGISGTNNMNGVRYAQNEKELKEFIKMWKLNKIN
ncbi:hypothetical protein [Caviibacter abscessus]|uniref:hypothetical protein n=1 Tax=Caviibacter abscessus TaxID=1766719 RepID=UPI00082F88F2|nr:hypothetical protein [Caviibacter abscessus]